MALTLPTSMVSGYTFAIDQMPAPIRAATLLVYARYYITILLAVFMKGSTLAELATPVLALAVYALAIIWMAARAFWRPRAQGGEPGPSQQVSQPSDRQ